MAKRTFTKYPSNIDASTYVKASTMNDLEDSVMHAVLDALSDGTSDFKDEVFDSDSSELEQILTRACKTAVSKFMSYI